MHFFTHLHFVFVILSAVRGKSILLEEAMRVPLIMSFPGRIAPNSSVSSPVSHLDVFATILDYVGASYLDKSDGSSLRSAIEGTRWNEFREEDYVVVETEKRVPMGNGNDLSKGLGDEPNFMIRKGRYQLMLPKNRNSQCMDMMFDLKNDKFQQNNLLGENAANLPLPLIEQAEYLKVLLLEWMQSNDGLYGYYSDPKYNADEGQGDMKEIEARRTWPEVEYWQSEDTTLVMKSPVWESGYYRQNAYLYIGRTAPGLLQVQSIRLNVGNDANAGLFQISPTSATIARGEYIRVKVSFRSFFAVSISDLKAKIEIYTNVGNRKVEIRGP